MINCESHPGRSNLYRQRLVNPVPEHLQEPGKVATVLRSPVQANCGEVCASIGSNCRACEQLLPRLHNLRKDFIDG